MQIKLMSDQVDALLKCFSDDLTATKASEIAKINRNTVNRYYGLIRKKILKYHNFERSEGLSPHARFVSRLKRSKIRSEKIKAAFSEGPILGLLERGKKVFTVIIDDLSEKSLHSVITGNIEQVLSDFDERYNALMLKACDQYQVFYNVTEITKEHIASIEHFIRYARERLAKFNGFSQGSFLLHLKECEFRYNHRDDDLFPLIKNIFQTF